MLIQEFLPYIYERDTYKGVAGYLWTRLIKRSVIFSENNELKVSFCNYFGVGEDVIFVAEMSLGAKRIAYLNKKLYYYFQREKSITHDDEFLLRNLSWAEAYEKIIDIYEKKAM